ncbi:MAG: hypothetical protein R3E82_11600 [Pseudomonadales bacterium]
MTKPEEERRAALIRAEARALGMSPRELALGIAKATAAEDGVEAAMPWMRIALDEARREQELNNEE